jgi:hypothetical protein
MFSIQDVITDCGPYVQALRQGKEKCFLVRSVPDYEIDIQRCFHSAHKRNPLNMDEGVHKAINLHFLNIFKWQVRNGVFCFGITSPTHGMMNLGYGRAYLMFPCGEFDYVYDDDIFDLYVHYRDFFSMYPDAELSQFIGSINYSNKDLKNVMSRVSSFGRSVEIIVNCQNYYLVSLKYIDDLVDLIWH